MSKDTSDETKPFLIFDLQLYHHHSSIKIGTDAVLLSAAIRRFCKAHRILDVGCGCGIVGLSYLKKHPRSHLIGLDIHLPSIHQSVRNARLNNLSDRADFQHRNFLTYHTDLHIDLIVSNPPYFQNQLQSPRPERNHARHADNNLPIHCLIEKACLMDSKELVLILPASAKRMVQDLAGLHRFYLFREILVYSKPDANKPVRTILFFGQNKAKETLEKCTLIIRNSDNSFNKPYLDFVYNS